MDGGTEIGGKGQTPVNDSVSPTCKDDCPSVMEEGSRATAVQGKFR